MAALLLIAMWFSTLTSSGGTNHAVALTISAYRLTGQLWSMTTENKKVIEDIESKIDTLLPVPEKRAWYCPEDNGSYYKLNFRYADNIVAIIKIKNSGCRWVTFQDNKHRPCLVDESLLYKLKALRPAGGPGL